MKENKPELLQKAKIHLILYLVRCMVEFGPCSGFNTEREVCVLYVHLEYLYSDWYASMNRCEAFNSTMRTHNIYANRAAPSRDIVNSFAVIKHLRFLCAGGVTSCTKRYRAVIHIHQQSLFISHFFLDTFRSAGNGLVQIFHSDQVLSFINGKSAKSLHFHKAIYQALRKVFISVYYSIKYFTACLKMSAPEFLYPVRDFY